MKVRYFSGNRKGIAPIYKTIELAIRSWIFPCVLKLVPIKDTLHAYIWRAGRVHFGIDILGEIGIPVVAVEDGVVYECGYDETYGFNVTLQHKDMSGYAVYTRSCHLDTVLVHKGQIVKQGQEIGKMGSTGDSLDPHLHLEVHILGINIWTRKRLPYYQHKAVDPIPFFNARTVRQIYSKVQNARVAGDDPGL